jgi:UTP--glucose-1-phosphate uridylyltransferase
MRSKGNILGLPMIRNSKTVNPRKPTSPQVYQLETAMGSAITVFENATAIRVPQSRFVQVKRTEDLLVVRSDICMLSNEFQVIPNPNRKLGPILVTLDNSYYQLVDDMEARFPDGVPSLINCDRLNIVGDIKFGSGITLNGVVELINLSGKQVEIEDGTTIDRSRAWSN